MNDFLRDSIKSTDEEPKAYEKMLIDPKRFPKPFPFMIDSDDELFLIIDNNPTGTDLAVASDSGVHMEYRQYVLNQKLNTSQLAKKKLPTHNAGKPSKFEETPKRKLRSRQYYDQLRRNTLSKRLPTPHSLFFQKRAALSFGRDRLELIRENIAQGIDDLNELIQYERQLMANLSVCCEQYRTQNKQYTTKVGLEMCIEEIQANLDFYSKEIVDAEFNLFRTQMEINQKQSVLVNLQRMLETEQETESDNKLERLLSHGRDAISGRRKIRKVLKQISGGGHRSSDFEFVDNVHEFCDNNKSIIV